MAGTGRDSRDRRGPADHVARGALIVHEDAFVDDGVGRGRNAFVVPAHRCAAARFVPIRLDGHELRTELERPQDLLGRRKEGRAGVVGLVAERAIELGRVRDRFVDGEPQMRRMQHEIPRARLDRRGRELHGRLFRPPPDIRRQVQTGDVFPAAAGRGGDGSSRLEVGGVRGHRRDGHVGTQSNEGLLDHRAVARRDQAASLTDRMLDDTNRTPFTFNASSFVLRRRSAFCSIGIVNGSISCGVIQRPSVTRVTGANRHSNGRDLVVGRGNGCRFACGAGDGVLAEIAGRGKSPRAANQRAHADAVGLGLA